MDNQERVKSQYSTDENLSSRQSLHSYNINKYDWHKWCLDNMRIPNGARVLELGCGNGVLWEKNIDKIHDSWDIVLSDFSEGMLNCVKMRLLNLHRKFSYEIIDIQSIPYPNESFDVVIARHMLYHVPDLNKALSEIKRVLKPGGVFYASTNGESAMMELKDLVDRYDPEIDFNPGRYTDKFGIISGEKLLKEFFNQLSLKLYEGRIVVTSPEPVINYVKSTFGGVKYFSRVDCEREFLEYINNEIQNNGSINITTIAGMFEAVKE